jgi:hypothetical protein
MDEIQMNALADRQRNLDEAFRKYSDLNNILPILLFTEEEIKRGDHRLPRWRRMLKAAWRRMIGRIR